MDVYDRSMLVFTMTATVFLVMLKLTNTIDPLYADSGIQLVIVFLLFNIYARNAIE